MEVKLYQFESYTDQRGTIEFCNSLNLDMVRRLYYITHINSGDVRAWQGHRFENKWFKVIKGSFLINLVKIDNWEQPSADLSVNSMVLSQKENCVIHLPGGYANGIMSLEPDSILQVFSNFSLEEGLKDNHKFEMNKWFDWTKFFNQTMLEK